MIKNNKSSDRENLHESLSNSLWWIYSWFLNLSNLDKMKSHSLPENEQDWKNFKNKFYKEEDLEDLEMTYHRMVREGKTEDAESSIRLFNRLLDATKKSWFLHRYYPNPNATSEEIVENSFPQKEEVTIVFSDIRNFTSKSQSLNPNEVLFYLNSFYKIEENIIMKYNGVIDKYMADGIMVLFSNPADAYCFAYEMRAKLSKLNNELMTSDIEIVEDIRLKLKNKIKIEIGIGIHTGEVIKGDVGGKYRFDQSVIGDNVNIASRIEGITKNITGNSVSICYSNIFLSKSLSAFEDKIKNLQNKIRPLLTVPKGQLDRSQRDKLEEELGYLTSINDRLINSQEFIDFQLKGISSDRDIRIFTDKPYNKKMTKEHIELYKKAMNLYHLGSSVSEGYRSLNKAYETLLHIKNAIGPDDIIINSSLDRTSKSYVEFLRERAITHYNRVTEKGIRKIHELTQDQKKRLEGKIEHYQRANYFYDKNKHGEAIAAYLSYFDLQDTTPLKYYAKYIKKKLDNLNKHLDIIINDIETGNIQKNFSNLRRNEIALRDLFAKHLFRLSKLKPHNEILEKVKYITFKWQKRMLDSSLDIHERITLGELIMELSEIFNLQYDPLDIYYDMTKEWVNHILTSKKVKSNYKSYEMYEILELIRYPLDEKELKTIRLRTL